MIAGLVTAAPLAITQKIPSLIAKAVGFILAAAGLWNVFWYGLQHLTEFWGLMALGSGILMTITAIFIIGRPQLPQWLTKLKPVVLLGLLGFALTYAITIIRL